MVRKASNSAVSEIEVEVDAPGDRDRKRDNVRSNSGAPGTGGTGASGTLKTNNSSGDWFLDRVTGYALGVSSSGVVGVKIQVADGNGNVKMELADDLAGGAELNFGGVKIKPGWSVDYVIEQDDSISYTVELLPLVRKPNPGDPKTVDIPDRIDSFEDGGLAEYTGDTASYSVISTDSYHLDNSLENAGNVSVNLYSTSGLDAYPSKGDKFSCSLKPSNINADKMRGGMIFAVQDSNNYYYARVNYSDKKILVFEVVSGSLNLVATSPLGSGFESGRWDKFTIEWGDTLQFSLTNGGDTLASVSVNAGEFTDLHTDGGFGWFSSVSSGESVRMDNAVIE